MGKLPLTIALIVNAPLFCADSALLKLVMPDAKVIAGLQVDKARLSPFGQFVLSHMQPDDPAFQTFVQQTTEIIMASNSETDVGSHWLILARGSFDRKALPSTPETALEFPDSSTAIVGDPELVKAAMRRSRVKAEVPSAMLDRVKLVSPKYDFWFVTLVPLSEFAALMPDVLKGGFFEAVTQASGGARFGDNVLLGAELTSRTEKDAQALADAVRFIVNLLQTNRGKSAAATQVSSLLDTLSLNTTGALTKLELAVPEQLVEEIVAPKKPGSDPGLR